MTDVDRVFGAPIHTYSRAQALEDGVLVDATATAREAGFRYPVALIRAAREDCVAWTDANSRRRTFQDQPGRLWDVLWMARLAAQYKRYQHLLRNQPRAARRTRRSSPVGHPGKRFAVLQVLRSSITPLNKATSTQADASISRRWHRRRG